MSGGLEKRSKITTEEERKCIANHEAGHATLSWLLEHANPLVKVTIVPRGKALGAAWYLPEERQITTREQLQDEMCATLGGRAAEELVFNSVTTGASNDIEQATAYVRNMITMYGMSEEFGLMALETVENQYLDGRRVLNCADATAAQIDQVVKETLKKCYEQAKQLLSENREVMDHLAEFLIKEETITGKEFMEIFHKYRLEQMERQVGMDVSDNTNE